MHHRLTSTIILSQENQQIRTRPRNLAQVPRISAQVPKILAQVCQDFAPCQKVGIGTGTTRLDRGTFVISQRCEYGYIIVHGWRWHDQREFCKTVIVIEVKLLFLWRYFFTLDSGAGIRQWLIQLTRVLPCARWCFQAREHHIQFVKTC